MNITKMAYHEPRPFMVTDKITVYGCSGEYGNPSGHSLFAAAFNIFFFLDLFHSNCDQPDFSTLKAKLIYAGALFLAISLTFLIGFARFYVGVHTLNQIVYGWQIGLLRALYFHICLREPVIKHIQTL
jgi:membrane-associated phospholipid phosphatase